MQSKCKNTRLARVSRLLRSWVLQCVPPAFGLHIRGACFCILVVFQWAQPVLGDEFIRFGFVGVFWFGGSNGHWSRNGFIVGLRCYIWLICLSVFEPEPLETVPGPTLAGNRPNADQKQNIDSSFPPARVPLLPLVPGRGLDSKGSRSGCLAKCLFGGLGYQSRHTTLLFFRKWWFDDLSAEGGKAPKSALS